MAQFFPPWWHTQRWIKRVRDRVHRESRWHQGTSHQVFSFTRCLCGHVPTFSPHQRKGLHLLVHNDWRPADKLRHKNRLHLCRCGSLWSDNCGLWHHARGGRLWSLSRESQTWMSTTSLWEAASTQFKQHAWIFRQTAEVDVLLPKDVFW